MGFFHPYAPIIGRRHSLVMITEDQIITLMQKVNPKIDLSRVTPTDTLTELDFDSLDRFNLLVELQEATGIEVPDEDIEKLESARTIREYLIARGG